MFKNNVLQQLGIKKQEYLFLHLFWIGFFLFTLGSIIAATEYVDIKLCQIVQALGFVMFVFGAVKNIEFKFDNFYLKTVFYIYILWLFITVLRGFEIPFNFDFIKEFIFGGANHGLIYFVPLVLLFPKKFPYYRKLFGVVFLFGMTYLILCALFIKDLLSSGGNELGQTVVESITILSTPIGFLLLTFYYQSKRRNLLSVVIIIATLIFAVIRARRGLIFITSSIMISSVMVYFFHSKKKLFLLYFFSFIALIISLYATNMYKVTNNKLFSFLAERGTEDTRTGVELYFYDDMQQTDWIIGKGMTGKYFCPDIEIDQPTNYRYLIETGYLQIILKGGILSLVLLLMIVIPASIKGLLFSRNMLGKAAAIWIILFIIKLYPTHSVSFDLNYLLVWFSVGICYSPKVLRMTDKELKLKFEIP